ncbi:putative acetyltransferase [Paenibacillus sp. DS2015]|uniref:GNAT family N-acetyltransferase n=1 Tax=Paenibacillus sp. DS2015 TaxID=3373917 RepID=UPI003D1D73DA
MNICFTKVTIEDKPILEGLASLYCHDLDEYLCHEEQADMNAKGLLEYGGLELYFTEEEFSPYFIKYRGIIIGFCLLQTGVYAYPGEDYIVGAYFILKKYRRQGMGREASGQLFESYPGKYRISQFMRNQPAIRFWKHVYAYYDIKFIELEQEIGNQSCSVQIFSTDSLHSRVSKHEMNS